MSTEYYTVEKKENDITIHSAMEIHMEIHIYQEISSFYIDALFRKMRTPFNSEPGTVLLSNLGK